MEVVQSRMAAHGKNTFISFVGGHEGSRRATDAAD
jgi:hypothetical protein